MDDLPFDPYAIDEIEMQAWCMAAQASQTDAEWADTLYCGLERYKRITRQIRVLLDLQRNVQSVIDNAMYAQGIRDYSCEYGYVTEQPATEVVSYNAAALDSLSASLPEVRQMLALHRCTTYVGRSLTIG